MFWRDPFPPSVSLSTLPIKSMFISAWLLQVLSDGAGITGWRVPRCVVRVCLTLDVFGSLLVVRIAFRVLAFC